MSSSKSSHASSSEHDFETDIDEDESPDPGSTRRQQSTMELDSDEESEVHDEFEAFFRQRRVPKRQREATPSSPSCSDSDDEQFYCRVQAQSAARRRQRREMESPIRNQNYQPLDLEQPTSPTTQNLEHQARVDPHYTSDNVSVSGTVQFVYLMTLTRRARNNLYLVSVNPPMEKCFGHAVCGC